MSSNSAFYLLSQLSQHGVTTAKGLPAQINITPHWSGVGFAVGDYRFVAQPGELTESLEQPGLTALPSVQSYVKGVSNVRGRLLPVIDFAEMFDIAHSVTSRNRQVVTVEVDDFYAGLVIDQVMGMQYFPEDSLQVPSDLPEQLKSVVTGEYVDDKGSSWWVFSPKKLVEFSKFAQVARSAT